MTDETRDSAVEGDGEDATPAPGDNIERMIKRLEEEGYKVLKAPCTHPRTIGTWYCPDCRQPVEHNPRGTGEKP